MAIKLKIHEMPKSTFNQEISAEHMSKIAKSVKRAKIASANVRKKFKKIDRAEAEALRNPHHRG